MGEDVEKLKALMGQLRELSGNADLETRQALLNALREVTVSFYDPWDAVMKISSASILISLIRIGIDLKLFPTIAESKTPLTLQQLADKTGAAPQLLERLLRAMESFSLVAELEGKKYTIKFLSKMMADPKAANVISRLYDIPGNCIQAMPIFLAEKNYQSPTSTKTTAFQKGFNTDLTYNDWVLQCPAYVKDPGSVMCLYQTVFWMDSYPVEEKLGSLATGPDTSLMVEIGGGVGEQATAFRNKFPHLTGRIIVQDSPAVLTKATPAPGITFTEHSLFKPQPITAAKLYYLRHVLQKWPDNDCVKILKNVIPAMGTESRLVIDDVVMPESQASWQSVYLDLILMNTTGGAFRTRLQWDALLNRAGLKILDVSQYDGAEMQHIIVAVPK